MENENKTKQDCDCATDPNCCAPKKNKLWMKIVFVAVIAAAATIITVKLVSDNSSVAATEQSSCDKNTQGCDPANNPSCCSQDTTK